MGSVYTMAQKNNFFIDVRIPVQVDFQKEDIGFPVRFIPKEQTATVLNYGIDGLAEKKFGEKVRAYAGAGYFRNKFKFRKLYDHQLLNIGRDSFPIGTFTHNYIYNLIRFPFGISYTITINQKNEFRIGSEIVFNCSYRKVYNGGKPFQNANNKYSGFQYSGYAINLFTCIAIPISGNSFFELEPYIRLYHTYRQDEILYENPDNTMKKRFNALGLSLKYSLNLKKIRK